MWDSKVIERCVLVNIVIVIIVLVLGVAVVLLSLAQTPKAHHHHLVLCFSLSRDLAGLRASDNPCRVREGRPVRSERVSQDVE
jgi:hypothetical protein